MKEGVSPRGLTSLALGIIGRAKHRDWHCEEQPGGGGVSYEIHATFTASTGWGPCKDANAFINRSLISPRLLGAAAPRRVQASRVQKGLMGKGEAGGGRRELPLPANSATICFVILLAFRGNIGVIYDPS